MPAIMKTLLRFPILLVLCLMALAGFGQDHAVPGELPNWLLNRDRVKAGILSVPENHNNPNSRKIQIAYAVLERRNKDSNAYPIILFTGGPGESSLAQGMVDFLRGKREWGVITRKGFDKS